MRDSEIAGMMATIFMMLAMVGAMLSAVGGAR